VRGSSAPLTPKLNPPMPTVIYQVGDDISTDVIYPGRFMATVLPTETPLLAFADDAAFNAKLRAKQIPARQRAAGRAKLRLRLVARAGRCRV